MFWPHKNSYLQLECNFNPRIINKCVDLAMRKPLDPHDATPAAQRMTSMLPSLYAPRVDVTRAHLGYGRYGLRILSKEIHNSDALVQLQAVHSIMDLVKDQENAQFLIKLNIVTRLCDLLQHRDPVIREKVCMIYTTLATVYQGRKRMLARVKVLNGLHNIIKNEEKKEIRYQAARCFKVLANNEFGVEVLLTLEDLIVDLLDLIRTEYTGIAVIHLNTLESLLEWDQLTALHHGAFKTMLSLLNVNDTEVIFRSLYCIAQLLIHNEGKNIGDGTDIIMKAYQLLYHKDERVIYGALRVMMFATLTTRSRWRLKSCSNLPERIVELCHHYNRPPIQLACFKVLMNLCDMLDLRHHIREHLLESIRDIKLRTHEEWNGTSETTTFTIDTGHCYRTMCIENTETIDNHYGGHQSTVNVHSYLRTLREYKDKLIEYLHVEPCMVTPADE